MREFKEVFAKKGCDCLPDAGGCSPSCQCEPGNCNCNPCTCH